MAKNNDCYYDGKSNIFNRRDIRQKFCNECGAPGKLTIKRPAPVLHYCDRHGAELVELRQVCSQRHKFSNRLKRFFAIGYFHMNDHSATLHIDQVSKHNFIRGK